MAKAALVGTALALGPCMASALSQSKTEATKSFIKEKAKCKREDLEIWKSPQ
jgi:hypothetical protein